MLTSKKRNRNFRNHSKISCLNSEEITLLVHTRKSLSGLNTKNKRRPEKSGERPMFMVSVFMKERTLYDERR